MFQDYHQSLYEGSPGIEQSYKVCKWSCLVSRFLMNYNELRFPSPSQMRSELDKQAAALVCQKHYCLRNELESLRRQYQHHDDLSRSYAGRIKEIQEKLEDLIVNVVQFFCDALDM